MFDEERLRSMKRKAFLVNVSRGAIVDRHAIVSALEDGHIAGYAGASRLSCQHKLTKRGSKFDWLYSSCCQA